MNFVFALLLLAIPSAIAAQAPPNRLEADLAKARADHGRDPSSADLNNADDIQIAPQGDDRLRVHCNGSGCDTWFLS
jgi:hypothetical protein